MAKFLVGDKVKVTKKGINNYRAHLYEYHSVGGKLKLDYHDIPVFVMWCLSDQDTPTGTVLSLQDYGTAKVKLKNKYGETVEFMELTDLTRDDK